MDYELRERFYFFLIMLLFFGLVFAFVVNSATEDQIDEGTVTWEDDYAAVYTPDYTTKTTIQKQSVCL